MADVRFGIDATGARAGADEFIRQLQRIETAAKQMQAFSGGGSGATASAAVRARQEETRATQAQTKASQDAARAAAAEERARLAQIRAGIAFLRVINDEHASYARRVDASLRLSRAMGLEIDTKKLLLGVQNQVSRARADSVKATTVEEIANRSLSRGLRGIRDDFRGLAAVLNVLPGNMGLVATQAARLAQGFALLGPLVGTLAAVATGIVGIAVAGDRLGRIPSALSDIWGGLKELVFQSAAATGWTDALAGALERVAALLPDYTGNIQEFVNSIDKQGAQVNNLNRQLGRLIDLKEKGLITEERYIELYQILAKSYDDVTGATERNRKAKEASERATREATEATEAYEDALANLRLEEENQQKSEAQRLEDLRISNDLLEKKIEALQRGTEALEAFNIEEARTLEAARQNRQGTAGSPSSEALIAEAERNARLENEQRKIQDSQKELAKHSETVWDHAIQNIQSGFGDLFTRVLTDGKDAFSNLGDFVKQLFARVIGEIVNTQIFGRLFGALSQAGQSAGSVGGAVGAGGAGGSVVGSLGRAFSGSGLAGGIFQALSLAVAGNALRMIVSGNLPGASSGSTFGALLQGATLGAGIPVLAGLGVGVIGGGLGAALGASTGTQAAIAGTAGALSSAAAGGFGAVVGGLVTLAVYLESKAKDYGVKIGTESSISALLARGIEGQKQAELGLGGVTLADITRETPFGFIGALRSGTGKEAVEGDPGFILKLLAGIGGKTESEAVAETIAAAESFFQSVLDAVTAIDLALAGILTRSEEQLVRGLELPDIGFSNAKQFGSKLASQRIRSVLVGLGIPEDTLLSMKDRIGTNVKVDEQISAASELLKERREILDFIDEVNGVADSTTEAGKALEALQERIDQIAISAPRLGIEIDKVALEATALNRMRETFNDTITDSILALTDPASLAANQLAESQSRRLREAKDLGADLVEIERLTMLERQALLKTINDPLQSTIDAIRFSTSGQSPRAALDAARSRFAEVSAGLASGIGGFQRGDLAASAQTLLTLGESLLGAPEFSRQRDQVLSTLESFLATMPGGSDTAISGLALETARGNAANESLLQQIVDENSAMRSELALLRSQLDRLLNQS